MHRRANTDFISRIITGQKYQKDLTLDKYIAMFVCVSACVRVPVYVRMYRHVYVHAPFGLADCDRDRRFETAENFSAH